MNGMVSATLPLELVSIINVNVTDDTLSVDLEDGRTISMPIGWYPRLTYGTPTERANFQISGAGYGIHWPDLDEDIGVEGILLGKKSNESPDSFERWLKRRAISDEKIIIYGNSDKEQFPTQKVLIDFLSTFLFEENQRRYRYTQCKDADIIIISREGLAHGHLVVEEKLVSTDEDIAEFPPAKCTYIISSSAVYQKPVKLYMDLGIKVTSFGTVITKEQFNEIKDKAGRITPYP